MRFKLPDELTRNILFWIQEKRWLLIIVLLGTLMYHMPYPDGIPHAGYRTLILCLIVISLIITEPIPLPAVALLIAVLEVAFHIAPATEVAKTYMNDSVFFYYGFSYDGGRNCTSGVRYPSGIGNYPPHRQ